MKKSIFAGAAIVALIAAGSASAHEAHLDLSYQSNDTGASDDVGNTALSGAILVTPHVQLNGRYANIDAFGNNSDYFSVDGFLFNRDDAWAYGGYLGYDNIDGDVDEWSIGGFVQAFQDNINWTAQLGYAETEGDAHNLNLDGEGRYFVTDDFALSGNLGYGDIDSDSNYWSGGLGAEFGMGSLPVSVYAGWEHYDFDDGNDVDDLGIGIRWNFGGGTVKERSRTGASMQRNTRTLGDLELGGGFAPR